MNASQESAHGDAMDPRLTQSASLAAANHPAPAQVAVIVPVRLVLAVDAAVVTSATTLHAQTADATNELLRPLQRSFGADTELLDYAFGRPIPTPVAADLYDEGDVFRHLNRQQEDHEGRTRHFAFAEDGTCQHLGMSTFDEADERAPTACWIFDEASLRRFLRSAQDALDLSVPARHPGGGTAD